jgi:undecaprenyl-diphosphatase
MKKLWFLAFGLVFLLVSLFFDRTIVLFFTSYRNPVFDFLAVFFEGTLVSVLLFLVVPFVILLFKDRRRAILFAVAFGCVLLLTYSIKFIVMRPRPFMMLNLPLIASFSYGFGSSDYSMPSSHASTSFSAFAGLERLSWVKWLYLSLAVVVCLSRLYSGVHYLSDVVVGALMGYFVTYLVFLAGGRYFGKKWKTA